MKIDLTQIIYDQEDKPVSDVIAMQTNGNVETILTLGKACANALMFQLPTETDLSGEDKFKRGELIFALKNDSLEISEEDLKSIREHIARVYSPVIVYRTFMMLNAKR